MSVALLVFAALAGYAFDPRLLDRYVSDEVWYVSAARNLLYLLGGSPRPCPGAACQVTVFYPSLVAAYEARPYASKLLEHATALVAECDAAPPGGTATRCCWIYPDKENIASYLNLEHPPLAKYIIAGFMLLLGDCPWAWRLPGVILVSLAAGVLAYTLVSYVVGSGRAGPISLTAILVALTFVHLLHSSLAVDAFAMLEAYVAGFGMLSVAAYLAGRRRLAYILAAAATLSKYTGLGYLAGLVLADRLEDAPQGWLRGLASALAALGMLALLLYAPLALRLGVAKLYEETIGGLEWFLESRPPGPPASTPLDWLLGRNAFMLSTNPEVYGAPNPVLFTVGLAASLALLASSPLRPREAALAAPIPAFIALVSIVYLAGNHTLYSYYTAAYEPLAPYAASLWLAALIARGRGEILEERRGVELLLSTPEARAAARLASVHGLPLAAMTFLLAAGSAGEAPGLLGLSTPTSRLETLALYTALLLLASTSIVWRSLEPGTVAAASLATRGYLPAATLLLLALGVESRGAASVAPLLYPSIAAVAYAEPPYTLLAVLAYIAARLTGLARQPTVYEYAALLAAAVYTRLSGRPPASAYALLALVDPPAALPAAALLASNTKLAAFAVLEAAGYGLRSTPAGTALLVLGAIGALARDAQLLFRRAASSATLSLPRRSE